MKFVIALALVAVVVARPDDSHYDSKFDNFNIKEVTENTKLMKNFANCFLERGKCSPEGKDIKEMMPEAMKSSCAKCTEPQKHHIATFIEAMRKRLPEDWEQLKAQNDPKNEHEAEINEFVAKYS